MLRNEGRGSTPAGDLDEELPFLGVKPASESRPDRRQSGGTPNVLVLLACVLCTIISVAIAISAPSIQYQNTTHEVRLRRPSQYIGLDKVNRTVPGVVPPDPLVNHPPTLTQVSRKQPTKVFSNHPRRFYSHIGGMIYPEDRRFLVTDDVHSIAQFRVLDFGMELCSIVIAVPAVHEQLAANKTATIGPGMTALIHVFRLDADNEQFFDAARLSWRTRPKRHSKQPMATLTVEAGTSAATEKFDCLEASARAFVRYDSPFVFESGPAI
ncbi:hypothetical protein PUNSTDRAFT_137782 [Punctularia strigosozonata HHB-11173 SS5]|uniref:Ubiquitin 3 binding protein But2 C-terminal domain-containing protein n=1 Tax=Punctularia strigosozonata (strain HHB-11173) TaxID=741275 RepID=R7S5U9_PUNST|nr:uncharacterized protein PUNSTDRAFT_137782 [Punctularia strigosozonata HHB-11173 SS5]EIN05096.1 hypothetical protein PUNSTDRAFT_137782 [Punctularia strigosozonata HHB-11173 SS5]